MNRILHEWHKKLVQRPYYIFFSSVIAVSEQGQKPKRTGMPKIIFEYKIIRSKARSIERKCKVYELIKTQDLKTN